MTTSHVVVVVLIERGVWERRSSGPVIVLMIDFQTELIYIFEHKRTRVSEHKPMRVAQN